MAPVEWDGKIMEARLVGTHTVHTSKGPPMTFTNLQAPAGAGVQDLLTLSLLKERIIFLGTGVDDAVCNQLVAQLLLLSAEDPKADIYLYINSPGGSISAGMALYDTMKLIPNDVVTVAMGMAASMGQFLLTAGTPGKRYVTEHARVMMHQPSGGLGGTASDIQIQAEQMAFIKEQMARLIAEHSGQTYEQITRDSHRDRWFSAAEAKDYGLVDHIVATVDEVTRVASPATTTAD